MVVGTGVGGAEVLGRLRKKGLTLRYEAGSGKLRVGPADRLGAAERAELAEQRSAVVAALVREAATSEEAWAALGLGGRGGGVRAHVRALTAGLPDERAVEIGAALAKGLGLIGGCAGPVPQRWVDRMVELHLETLGLLWGLDGRPTQTRVFQVLGAIPVRQPVDWLEEGIARLDRSKGEAGEEAARDLVERAVTEWLGHESAKEKKHGG